MTPLLPVVESIVAELGAQPEGVGLTADRLVHWAEIMLLQHADTPSVFEQLLVLAKRLQGAGAELAAVQLTALAAVGVHHLKQHGAAERALDARRSTAAPVDPLRPSGAPGVNMRRGDKP